VFHARLRGCPTRNKRRNPAASTKTKQPGIIFSANAIRWLKDSEVEVDGGYHCGGLCASGEVFTVVLENRKWRVIADRMKWIS